MKKRLAALLLVLLMLAGFVLTSCNLDEGEITEEITRRPLTITLYCVKESETTPEAVKMVQDAINSITKKRFKTQIILKFYTEEEYVKVIDDLVADIALDEKQKADNAAASVSAAKESKRIAAIDKLIAADKAEVTTRTRIVWSKEEEETTAEETYETEKNILNENVEKFPTASPNQLDIFLICGTDNLNKYVNDETYATDGDPFLVSMDESLTLSAKSITQYVNSTVLLAGKVNNVQYAIPTNKQVADKSTYLIIDKTLLKKYGIDDNSIKAFTSTNYIKFLQAVKENEPDKIPLLSRTDAPGIVSIFGEPSIFGTYVSNTAVAGFKAVPKNLLSTYQYTDHIIYMEQYIRNGYVGNNENAENWASKVITATAEEIEEYDENKYSVKVLSKGMATNDTVGQYMFGISKYAANPARCMEIITYLTTNAEFRNLLQYGIEGYNYKIDVETGKLVRLNHEYMMDIFATGNTFIAYPEEDMELDVWERAKEVNRTAIVSPYMGFIYEKNENGELIEKMKALSAKILERINAYDVEADRVAKIEEYNKKLDEAKALYNEKKALVDVIEPRALEFIAAVNAAKEAAAPYQTALAAAKSAVSPYDSKISTLQSQISALKNRISVEKAKKPTDDEPDLKPDEKLIAEWESEMAGYEEDIRAERGYSYELRKALAEAQAEYDVYNAAVKDAEKAYEADTFTDPDDGAEKNTKKAYEARLSNCEKFEKDVEDIEKAIKALYIPEQSAMDEEYNAAETLVATLKEDLEKLNKQIEKLRADSSDAKAAAESAKEALLAAQKVLAEKEEAFAPYRRNSAIALSYVADKETEINDVQKKLDTENAKEKPDEKKIEGYVSQLETLNGELEELKKTYNDEVLKGKAQQDAYETALADYNAKADAVEAANNAEALVNLAEAEAEYTDVNAALKKASSALDATLHYQYEYYDQMAKDLYGKFFKSIVEECEKDPDYQIFMNVGEEAENDKGIVSIYNSWYESMYGE